MCKRGIFTFLMLHCHPAELLCCSCQHLHKLFLGKSGSGWGVLGASGSSIKVKVAPANWPVLGLAGLVFWVKNSATREYGLCDLEAAMFSQWWGTWFRIHQPGHRYVGNLLIKVRNLPQLPLPCFFRHLLAHIPHFLESASAHKFLDIVREFQGLEKCHQEAENISVLSTHHTLFPTLTSIAPSLSFPPLLPFLDPQSVVSALFSSPAFCIFCLSASFLLPLFFCCTSGVLLGELSLSWTWNLGFSNKSGPQHNPLAWKVSVKVRHRQDIFELCHNKVSPSNR